MSKNLRQKIAAKTAEIKKMAFTEKNEMFVQWLLMTKQDDPVSPQAMAKFITRTWGLEPTEPAPKKPSGAPRWAIGDRVEIKASSHKDGTTLDIYRKYDRQVGTVILTHLQDPSLQVSKYADIMVRLDNGQEVRFPEAQKGSRVGIGVETRPPRDLGGSKVEAVYISDPSAVPTPRQIAIAEAYVARGERRNENRSYQYYTGLPQFLVKQGNSFLFGFTADQRGGEIRSFNPAKGSLLYIGEHNKYPSGWEREYATIVVKTEHILQDKGE